MPQRGVVAGTKPRSVAVGGEFLTVCRDAAGQVLPCLRLFHQRLERGQIIAGDDLGTQQLIGTIGRLWFQLAVDKQVRLPDRGAALVGHQGEFHENTPISFRPEQLSSNPQPLPKVRPAANLIPFGYCLISGIITCPP